MHCGIEICLTDLGESLSHYGFVNLTNDNEEIIAFYCPNKLCKNMIKINGDIGLSDIFFDEKFLWETEGILTKGGTFKYHAPFNLVEQNKSLFKHYHISYKTGFMDEDMCDFFYSEKDNSYFDYLPKGNYAYSSLNMKHTKSAGEMFYHYIYPKKDIDILLEIENKKKIRIFPRYILSCDVIDNSDILCNINSTFNNDNNIYDLRSSLIEDETISTEERKSNSFLDILRCSRSESNISRIFKFAKLLTPQIRNIDNNLLHEFRQGDSIWNNFYDETTKFTLDYKSKIYIEQYVNLYSKSHFCRESVENLICRHRNDIYSSIMSNLKGVESRSVVKLAQNIRKKTAAFNGFITENIKILSFELEAVELVKMKEPRNFLITGETGTGKSYIAEAMHKASGRHGDFIHVNIPGIAENLFESELFGHKRGSFTGAISDKTGKFVAANKGTLFLDEIGDLPLHLQVKLLDAIQKKKITPVGSNATISLDIMLIFATNKNLSELIDKNEFREDLYYRIAEVDFTIPPLRERKSDIPLLAHHFVKQFARQQELPHLSEVRLSEEGAAYLADMWLRGNARELEKLIDRILSNRTIEGRLDAWPISREEIIRSHSPLKSKRMVTKEDVLDQSTAFRPDASGIKPARVRIGMRDKKMAEEVLDRLYADAKDGKSRGIIKQAAATLGVTPEHFSRVARKWGLVYPWKKSVHPS